MHVGGVFVEHPIEAGTHRERRELAELGRVLVAGGDVGGAALVVDAAAAVLAVVVVVEQLRPSPETEFVAVLTAGGDAPAFVATVNTAAGTISVRRVAEAAPADKSYELWSIAPNEAPKSLGVVEQVSLTQPLPVSPSGDLTLAISLEPKGGSPTGVPTEVVSAGPAQPI